MEMRELPAAIQAEEVCWHLPDAGQVLCYRAAGDGVPVLLLHSINAAPSAFEVGPIFAGLRGERPLYAPDLPGFGRSERRDRSYSPEFYGAAIGQMLDAIGAEAVDLLALSTTSEFAAIAAQRDDRVRSLVLVSPTGLMKRNPPSAKTGDRVLSFLQLPGVGAGLFTALRGRASVRFFLNKAFEGDAPAEMVDYAWLTARQAGARYVPFHFLSGKLFTADAVDAIYRKVTQPALVLFDRDPNISFDRLDELLSSGGNWHSQRIPDTRGLPHFEKPAETLDALRAFWDDLQPS
jgi:pimeloyl-ACP methyl ester carboxylesterase